VVTGYSGRQEANEPNVWLVTVRYAGLDNPAALPSEVNSESIEYTTHEWIDADHRPVENSAHDPILGGMPVSRNQKMIRITRAIPWESWDMDLGCDYENTLNQSPFVLSRQVRGGNPVALPPGYVRIKRITEQEIVYAHNPTTASRKSYWRVTVELHVDKRVIRLPDGRVVPVRHRWPVADAGYRELNAGGQPVPICQGSLPANEFQLLNGAGKVLYKAPPKDPVVLTPPGDVEAIGDYYVAYKNTTLTVAAPGVLANDEAGATVASNTSPTLHGGTAAVDPDGGFTYTPDTGFTGWDEFEYIAEKGGDTSNSTTVFVLVRDDAGPVWLFFSPYRYADWTPLAPLLANW
jgi:hypothetical protein